MARMSATVAYQTYADEARTSAMGRSETVAYRLYAAAGQLKAEWSSTIARTRSLESSFTLRREYVTI